MLLSSPTWDVLIEALVGDYSYKDVATGGVLFKDLPEKNQYSHLADALQYALLDAANGARYTGRQRPEPPRVIGAPGR